MQLKVSFPATQLPTMVHHHMLFNSMMIFNDHITEWRIEKFVFWFNNGICTLKLDTISYILFMYCEFEIDIWSRGLDLYLKMRLWTVSLLLYIEQLNKLYQKIYLIERKYQLRLYLKTICFSFKNIYEINYYSIILYYDEFLMTLLCLF